MTETASKELIENAFKEIFADVPVSNVERGFIGKLGLEPFSLQQIGVDIDLSEDESAHITEALLDLRARFDIMNPTGAYFLPLPLKGAFTFTEPCFARLRLYNDPDDSRSMARVDLMFSKE